MSVRDSDSGITSLRGDNYKVRICYFGTYDKQRPRNRNIISGFKTNNIDVVECHYSPWGGIEDKGTLRGPFRKLLIIVRFLIAYPYLAVRYLLTGPHEAVIVGYLGHIDIFFIKPLTLFRRKPLIFDAFLSLYDTAVMDRGIVSPGSLKAKLLWLLDKWSCKMADAVLLDTQTHVDYFVREFRLPAEKFHVIPVGSSIRANEESLPLQSDNSGHFTVLYFGAYIPLHGVEVILQAAKIVQDKGNDVLFTLVGTGQLLPAMKELAARLGLKNAIFIERFVSEEELVGYIRQADVCLGVFGQTDKAGRVIPCKVYNSLAMGKPLITMSGPAVEGVLTHKENAFLCKPGDPAALAEAILSLKNDKTLREKIARNGQDYFEKNFSADAIGKKVLEVISRRRTGPA